MEQSIFEILLKNLPFTSKILLIGLISGFSVYLFMKLYARFERTEAAVTELAVWAKSTDAHLAAIDVRLDAIEVGLTRLEIRIDHVEQRLEKLEQKIDQKFDMIVKLLSEKK